MTPQDHAAAAAKEISDSDAFGCLGYMPVFEVRIAEPIIAKYITAALAEKQGKIGRLQARVNELEGRLFDLSQQHYGT